jgi:hypothetical protein
VRVRGFSTAPARAEEVSDHIVFPREKEGNIYDDNWSMVVDGVTPTGNAYRNARLSLLLSHAGVKGENGKLDVTKPKFHGNYVLQESGAELTHDHFNDINAAQADVLSSEPNLYVEDGGLGAHSPVRVFVRFTSSNPSVALVARNLLVGEYVVRSASLSPVLLYRFLFRLERLIIWPDITAGIRILAGNRLIINGTAESISLTILRSARGPPGTWSL